MADESLLTPKQLAAREGLSEGKIRHLIHTRRLEFVKIGGRYYILSGAFQRFLEANKVMPWEDETKVPGFDGSKSERATTSVGPKAAAAGSAARARKTASELKSR